MCGNKLKNHILTGNFCVSDPLKPDENVYFCLSVLIKNSAASGLSLIESSGDLNTCGKTSVCSCNDRLLLPGMLFLLTVFYQDYCLERKNAIYIKKYQACSLNWVPGTFLSIPTESRGLSKMVISSLLGRVVSDSLAF